MKQKVSQLFIVSFAGHQPTADFLALLHRNHFGGVILYSRNCASASQVSSLLATLRHASPFPLLACTDQEGGIVVRLRSGVHVFPSEATYGQQGATNPVYQDAATTARDLKAVGLTMNLAPVVDVLANPKSPIGTRSYGPDPQLDARLTVAAIQGYQQHGMAATAKHFIGLGHASVDSHASLPTVNQSLAQFEQNDLIPFRAAIAAGVSSLLVAHVYLPAIDNQFRPASLSPVVIGGLIRKHLGFNGLVMTDSLIMGAVPGRDAPDAAVQALAAGADVLLLGANVDIPDAVIEDSVQRVVAAVRAGRIPMSRVEEALGRFQALKRQFRVPGAV